MGLSTLALNLAADAIAGNGAAAGDRYASAHTADPGGTGASEVAGGTPAYERIGPVTWDPVSGGVVMADTGAPVVFDIPGGATVRFAGLWDALTGGNWVGGDAVSEVAFTGQGTYELTAVTITVAPA